MSDIATIVIVGAGLAGSKAAEALRSQGYDGRLVLIGDEAHAPYLRPPLSKEYLRGEKPVAKVLVHPEAWYEEQRIERRSRVAVTAIDVRARAVALDTGEGIGFDRLLLATGAASRRLPVPGQDLPGIHVLRTLDDADALRAAAADARHVAVVGAGWIGSEVAASLTQMGLPVTLIGDTRVPLERVLGTEVGTIYRDLHARHGVDLRMGERVTAFAGRTAVQAVETASGSRIEADLVVVGVGARPRTELAVAAGLDVDGGIVVDEHLESSVPGIFAAGDVAAAWHPGFDARLRLEHWDNARRQARAAAANMLGAAESYTRVPYFYSDQYDLGMEYAGYAPSYDRLAFRGDPRAGEFIAFWLKDGRVVAGMNANIWDVNDAISALVASRRAVDVDRLVDPAVPLADVDALVPSGGTLMS